MTQKKEGEGFIFPFLEGFYLGVPCNLYKFRVQSRKPKISKDFDQEIEKWLKVMEERLISQ